LRYLRKQTCLETSVSTLCSHAIRRGASPLPPDAARREAVQQLQLPRVRPRVRPSASERASGRGREREAARLCAMLRLRPNPAIPQARSRRLQTGRRLGRGCGYPCSREGAGAACDHATNGGRQPFVPAGTQCVLARSQPTHTAPRAPSRLSRYAGPQEKHAME